MHYDGGRENLLFQGFDNYSFVGDVAVIAICVVVGILLTTSYISRIKSLWIFLTITLELMVTAGVNIGYHALLINGDPSTFGWIYALRLIYNVLIFNLLFLFILYFAVASNMDHRKAKAVAIVSCLLFTGFMGFDVIQTVMGEGFHITAEGVIINKSYIYLIGYGLFMLILSALMSHVRQLLYKRVMYGFYGTILVSLILCFGQMLFRQSSLTTMAFVLPVIAMLYIMHSSPYDVTLGAVDRRSFENLVHTLYEKKTSYYFEDDGTESTYYRGASRQTYYTIPS